MNKKNLYLAENFNALSKLSDISKLLTNDVKMTCRVLERLFESYEKANLEKDEELTFVYAMRFLDLYSKSRKVFQRDLKYIDAIISGKQIINTLEIAEELKTSLKQRYTEKLASAKKEKELSAAPTKPIWEAKGGPVTAQWLFKALKSGGENVFIIDVRPRSEFLKCSINHSRIINIPGDVLKPGSSVTDVQHYMESSDGDKHHLQLWKERNGAASAVLIAWNGSESSQMAVKRVHECVYKWDSLHQLPEPCVLEGGLERLQLCYPTLLTDSDYQWQSSDMDPTASVDKINYPQLDKPPPSLPSPASTPSPPPLPQAAVRGQIKQVPKPLAVSPMEPLTDPFVEIPKQLPTETALVKVPDRSLKPKLPVHLPANLESLSEPDGSQAGVVSTGGQSSNSIAAGTAGDRLPPWLKKVYDEKIRSWLYLDHRTGIKHREPPKDEDSAPVTPTSPQKVAPPKPLYVEYKQPLRDDGSGPSGSSSNMKRSSSQPNLHDDSAATPNSPSMGRDKRPPEMPDRHNKPSIVSGNSSSGASIDVSKLSPAPSNNPVPATIPAVLPQFSNFTAVQITNFNPVYRSVKEGLTGLRNLGNTCYMASVLQALSQTKFLVLYLLGGHFQEHVAPQNPLGHHGRVVNQLAALLQALWLGKYAEVSPLDLRRIVQSVSSVFRGHDQHDSQEFLIFLLDALHEDLNRAAISASAGPRPPPDPKFEDDPALADAERATRAWNRHKTRNDSVIVELFQGLYRSSVRCRVCQTTSVTFEAFMYLSLPMPPAHVRCSLQDCLSLFLAEEGMTGQSRWYCPRCKTARDASKKMDIWRLPPYLLIHLKRFSSASDTISGGSMQKHQKLTSFVDFPIQKLHMDHLILQQQQSHASHNHKYHLYAVSNHHGNMESGHYTSYCRNFKSDEWFNFDDEVVSSIREDDVKTSAAYILFYESYSVKQAEFKS